LRVRYFFLALFLQILLSATAFAWTPLDDKKAQFDGSQQCKSYSLVPVQSQEEEQQNKQEEEEPDCE
jgi:hypothetical protein